MNAAFLKLTGLAQTVKMTLHLKFARPPETQVYAINFARTQSIPLALKRGLAKTALGYLGLNVLIALVLLILAVFSYMGHWQTERALRANLAAGMTIPKIESAMAELYLRASQNLTQLGTFIAPEKGQFRSADKISALARTLPSQTWIKTITENSAERSMTVHALYLVNPDKPYELPTKAWAEALKADPDFGKDLKRIELRESSQTHRGSTELYTFQFLAKWKASGGGV